MSQKNLEKLSESGDIRDLNEVVAITIAEAIAQSEKGFRRY